MFASPRGRVTVEGSRGFSVLSVLSPAVGPKSAATSAYEGQKRQHHRRVGKHCCGSASCLPHLDGDLLEVVVDESDRVNRPGLRFTGPFCPGSLRRRGGRIVASDPGNFRSRGRRLLASGVIGSPYPRDRDRLSVGRCGRTTGAVTRAVRPAPTPAAVHCRQIRASSATSPSSLTACSFVY